METRLFALETGAAFTVERSVSISPRETRIAIQVDPYDIDVLLVDDIPTYVHSQGEIGARRLDAALLGPEAAATMPRLRLDRITWVREDVLRVTAGACCTSDLYDVCNESGQAHLLEKNADGSDAGVSAAMERWLSLPTRCR